MIARSGANAASCASTPELSISNGTAVSGVTHPGSSQYAFPPVAITGMVEGERHKMPRSVNHAWLMRQGPGAIRSSIQRYYRLNGTEPESTVRALRDEANAERRRFQEVARDPDYSVVLAADRRYAAISIAELQAATNALSAVIQAEQRRHVMPSRAAGIANRRGAAQPRRRPSRMDEEDEPSFGDDAASFRNAAIQANQAERRRYANPYFHARTRRRLAQEYEALGYMGLGSSRDFRNVESGLTRRPSRADREETPEYEPGPVARIIGYN